MSSKCTQRRRHRPDRHLRGRHRHRHGHGAGAEPGGDRRAEAARGGQAQGVTIKKKSTNHGADGQPDLAGRALRRALPEQLRRPLQIKDVLARVDGVGEVQVIGGQGLRHADLARSGPAQGPRPDHQRRGRRDPRAERPGRRRPDRRAADAGGTRVPVHGQHPGPAGRRRAVREHHRQGRRRAAAGAPAATSPGSSSAPQDYNWYVPARTARRRSALGDLPAARAPTRWTWPTACRGDMDELASGFPTGLEYSDRLRHDHVRRGLDRRGDRDPAHRGRSWWSSRSTSSCRTSAPR